MQNNKLRKGAASGTPTVYCLLYAVYSRAFSLAELMVAVGVLGIGMLIIAAAFPVALDQTRQALELSTSQMVFNDAVNNLRTKVNWIELENYFTKASPTLQFGTTGIWRLDFNQQSGTPSKNIFENFNQDASQSASSDLVFSSDNTYGWVAAVQKVQGVSQCYKFWIFILREPTGVLDGNNFKFSLQEVTSPDVSPIPTPTAGGNVATRNLSFSNSTFPGREITFLANNGQFYRIVDSANTSSTTVTASCNQQVSDGDSNNTNNVSIIAYPGQDKKKTNYQVTRKNPVVAVFETVITY